MESHSGNSRQPGRRHVRDAGAGPEFKLYGDGNQELRFRKKPVSTLAKLFAQKKADMRYTIPDLDQWDYPAGANSGTLAHPPLRLKQEMEDALWLLSNSQVQNGTYTSEVSTLQSQIARDLEPHSSDDARKYYQGKIIGVLEPGRKNLQDIWYTLAINVYDLRDSIFTNVGYADGDLSMLDQFLLGIHCIVLAGPLELTHLERTLLDKLFTEASTLRELAQKLKLPFAINRPYYSAHVSVDLEQLLPKADLLAKLESATGLEAKIRTEEETMKSGARHLDYTVGRHSSQMGVLTRRRVAIYNGNFDTRQNTMCGY